MRKNNPMDQIDAICYLMKNHAHETHKKAVMERTLLALLVLAGVIAYVLSGQLLGQGQKVSLADIKDPTPVYHQSDIPGTNVSCGITAEMAANPQKVYVADAEITHYTYNSAEEASGDCITATGLVLTPDNLAYNCATHWSKVPPGSKIELPNGHVLYVTDRIPESTRQHDVSKILIDRPVLTRDIAIKEGRKKMQVKVHLP